MVSKWRKPLFLANIAGGLSKGDVLSRLSPKNKGALTAERRQLIAATSEKLGLPPIEQLELEQSKRSMLGRMHVKNGYPEHFARTSPKYHSLIEKVKAIPRAIYALDLELRSIQKQKASAEKIDMVQKRLDAKRKELIKANSDLSNLIEERKPWARSLRNESKQRLQKSKGIKPNIP